MNLKTSNEIKIRKRIIQEFFEYPSDTDCKTKCNNCVLFYSPSGIKVYKCGTEDSSFLIIFILSIILIVLLFLILILIFIMKRKRREFILNNNLNYVNNNNNNESSNLKRNSARNLNVFY